LKITDKWDVVEAVSGVNSVGTVGDETSIPKCIPLTTVIDE
jgi:hypothetical protein